MFISRKEKEELQTVVQGLQNRVRDLEIETIWLKSKLYKEKKPPLLKDDAGPWGYKKDGTPRKRTGRPPQVMKVGQP
jgi:hypothetical protein